MIEFLTSLINGLSLGGVYAMIALGYTMVYGIAKMLNFAHGDIIMVGGYTVVVFFTMMKLPAVAGIAMAVLVCMLIGIATERFAYRPLRGASPLAVLITAIGVSYLLQSVAQIIFGTGTKYASINTFGVIRIGELQIEVATLITLATAVLVMIGLMLFIKKNKLGKAMLAVSEDKDAARLMGINVNSVVTLTFIIGSALAGLAGVAMLFKSPSVTNTMGAMPGIKAFTAAVIGGIGSIPGAMLGGLLLGLVEAVCNSIPVLAPYTVAIEFLILIVILLVKPTGLIGKKKREKV